MVKGSGGTSWIESSLRNFPSISNVLWFHTTVNWKQESATDWYCFFSSIWRLCSSLFATLSAREMTCYLQKNLYLLTLFQVCDFGIICYNNKKKHCQTSFSKLKICAICPKVVPCSAQPRRHMTFLCDLKLCTAIETNMDHSAANSEACSGKKKNKQIVQVVRTILISFQRIRLCKISG